MVRLHSITSHLLFFSVVAFMAVAACVTYSYFISAREIKTIMATHVGSVADTMRKSLEYIARIKRDAFRDENFKKTIYDMKLGKTGYLFKLDEKGTVMVHKKDERKNLAERTSSSTHEIETVTKGVQEETTRAVHAIATAEKSIVEGEILSPKSGEALNKIVEGAGRAALQMGEIARATEEQERGSEQIITNVTNMKELTNQVSNSTIEQSGVAALIARNTEEVTDMIRYITSACDEQQCGSEQVMVAVEDIRNTTNTNFEVIHVMNEALAKLYSQAEILKKEMSVFRV